MTDAPVLAATAWNTNADMIVDVVRLGYIKPKDWVLDLTYGRGNWWTKYRPDEIITNDGDKNLDADYHDDFRKTAWDDNHFDVVAYDPPYVCVGGRKTTGMDDMYSRFGLIHAPRSPKLLQELIDGGLTEAYRICKPKGFVLVKCADYISSGKLWVGTHHTLTHALELGFKVQDRLEMTAVRRRPQPKRKRQCHAGRNLSTLFVLQKPRDG